MEDKILEKVVDMIDGLTAEIVKSEYEKMEEGSRKDILTGIFALGEKVDMIMSQPLTEDESNKQRMSYISTVGLAVSQLDKKLMKYSQDYMKEKIDSKSIGGGYNQALMVISKM